jgi:hypothetical protein
LSRLALRAFRFVWSRVVQAHCSSEITLPASTTVADAIRAATLHPFPAAAVLSTMPPSKRSQSSSKRALTVASHGRREALPRRKGLHAHISNEEVQFIAAVLMLMNGNADDLAKTIEAGKTFVDSDAAIVVSETCVLVLEWDGEIWHNTEERKANDVRKTKQILDDFPQAVVVRMRSKCGPLPALDKEPRAIIIETKRNTAEAAQQLAARLATSQVEQVPEGPQGPPRRNAAERP